MVLDIEQRERRLPNPGWSVEDDETGHLGTLDIWKLARCGQAPDTSGVGSTSRDFAAEGQASRGRLIAARVVALVAALFWGVLFFGIIDLLVVPVQDEEFFQFYLIETGWGLLYTLLVMLPLVLWAVRPGREVFLQQALAAAAAVLLCGLAALAPGQVFVAGLLAGSALAPAALAGQSLRPIRGSLSGSSPLLGGLAVVAAASALVYAMRMVHASYTGAVDDDTLGLMHLPMQAAFGLALAGSASISVLAGGANASGWRFSVVPAAASAVWLGVVSVVYPDHRGSLGTVGGTAAIAWGIAFAVAALLVRRNRA